jgi:SAM-dependent methyltransferase
MSAGAYVPASIPVRIRRTARRRGIVPLAWSMATWGLGYAAGLPATVRGSRRAFAFRGANYPYLFHRHGFTWLNERAVEVPIAARALRGAPDARVLEVGNVLGHYGHTGHTVVDKYERGPGVINVDALAFEPPERYDLILSVSTVEHIGWDETQRDPQRAERTVEALARHLAPGGLLLITLPVGYNPVLDDAVRAGRVRFDTLGALRRTARTRWEEVAPREAWTAPYDDLLCAAGAVLVGTVRAR